jgi:hypothetical protein
MPPHPQPNNTIQNIFLLNNHSYLLNLPPNTNNKKIQHVYYNEATYQT